MNKPFYLVTGGTGFIGAAIVKRLIDRGSRVRVFDNNSRGALRRLSGYEGRFEMREGDIRDPLAVAQACAGVDGVFHLAFVNGTEFFYSKPDLVLEVGVKGMINVLEGCEKHHVPELILASSSEVYQTPAQVPTNENVSMIVPDPLNPRYSYGSGKIISEMVALHCGKQTWKRVLIFRPHNVYGPDMGWEHVLPQFALRMKALHHAHPKGALPFQIQGEGRETRAFVYIDDFVDGIECLLDRGDHRGIYHIGTQEEVTVREVAQKVGAYFNRDVQLISGKLAPGGTPRRCPDISKISALGYRPKNSLDEGILKLINWYTENEHLAPNFKGERVS